MSIIIRGGSLAYFRPQRHCACSKFGLTCGQKKGRWSFLRYFVSEDTATYVKKKTLSKVEDAFDSTFSTDCRLRKQIG